MSWNVMPVKSIYFEVILSMVDAMAFNMAFPWAPLVSIHITLVFEIRCAV